MDEGETPHGFCFSFVTRASISLFLAAESEEERMAWTGCIRTASFGQAFVSTSPRAKAKGTFDFARPKSSSQLDDQRTSFVRRSAFHSEENIWEEITKLQASGDLNAAPRLSTYSHGSTSGSSPSGSPFVLTPSPTPSSPSPDAAGGAGDTPSSRQSKTSKLAHFLRRSVSEKEKLSEKKAIKVSKAERRRMRAISDVTTYLKTPEEIHEFNQLREEGRSSTSSSSTPSKNSRTGVRFDEQRSGPPSISAASSRESELALSVEQSAASTPSPTPPSRRRFSFWLTASNVPDSFSSDFPPNPTQPNSFFCF